MATMRRSRRMRCLRALLALAVPASLVTYLLYFTPEKLAVRKHLTAADAKSKAAIDERLKPLTELFARGRKGAKAFAEDALSWGSKWHMVKGLFDDGASHRAYLSAAFARHVFSPEELSAAIESVVRAWLDDVEGFESEMLVQLRADLVALGTSRPMPARFAGDEEFRREYRQLAGRVGEELRAELGVTVAREVGLLAASEIAAQTALQAAKAAASELGVSAGVLSTGALSTVATVGLGLVVSIILDYLLDQLLQSLGYDAAAKIEALVCESINKLEAALLYDPGFYLWETKGSLRQQLEQLHDARSRLRRETIHRFLKEDKR